MPVNCGFGTWAIQFIEMEERPNLPDADRLSILVASILLAYVLASFINLGGDQLGLQLPGFFFSIDLSVQSVVRLLVAVLAAVGADWLIRSHPDLGGQTTIQHWMLPALTAWVIGVPLSSIEPGPGWWGVLGFGALLLILVFIAEYISVDLSGALYAPATVGLTALSFALALILTITIRAGSLRLYLIIPAVVITIFLVVLRSLYMRLGGRWLWAWAAAIAVVVGQLALAFHYLPIRPLSYGLLILGPAYALTSLAGALIEQRPGRTLWIEPVLMLVVIWGLAIALGGLV